MAQDQQSPPFDEVKKLIFAFLRIKKLYKVKYDPGFQKLYSPPLLLQLHTYLINSLAQKGAFYIFLK